MVTEIYTTGETLTETFVVNTMQGRLDKQKDENYIPAGINAVGNINQTTITPGEIIQSCDACHLHIYS